MSKRFPLTWPEWSGGVEKAFQFLEEMEELRARGIQPSEEDALMLPVITLMVAKYHRNGRRKDRGRQHASGAREESSNMQTSDHSRVSGSRSLSGISILVSDNPSRRPQPEYF